MAKGNNPSKRTTTQKDTKTTKKDSKTGRSLNKKEKTDNTGPRSK